MFGLHGLFQMSAGLVHQEMRRTYAAQRGVSQGASVTLAAVSGGFAARFECARRCEQVLGNRGWQDDSRTIFLIPTQDLHSAISALSETLSVALVDTVTDENGTRFVLVWRITPTRKEVMAVTDELDEY
jgi:hypothetical protein